MWVGRTEESDEHLVVNELGHVVRARTVRRCVETRTVVQTSSSSMQLLHISNLMVMMWKSERGGLRRQDAERASRHMQTNTWYDVKHVDMIIV